jgi:hypothetical protein
VSQKSLRETQGVGFQRKNLERVNFTNCLINKPTSQKFILKNLSGIKTTFIFDAERYAAEYHELPQEKTGIELAMEEAERRERQEAQEERNSPTKKNKKKVGFVQSSTSGFVGLKSLSQEQKKRTKPILSDKHEQTQKFSSAMSKTFTKTKQLEKEQNFYLKGNRGLAVVFSPHIGELPPNSEVPITVTIYNNVCGQFDDKIIAKVKGLPDVEFPLNILIGGSPVRVPVGQVGVNYNTIPPTLPLPTVVARTKSI